MTPIVRPHAVCETSAVICPRCGHILVGRSTPFRGGTLTTCLNKTNGRNCRQRVIILPHDLDGTCTVIGIDRREADAIMAQPDRPLREQLRELGVIVGRVA